MRQSGRVASESVISCNFDTDQINKCINKMSTIPKKKYHNPYYKKNSINNAIQIIKKFDYKQNLIKDFYDTF